MQISAISKSFGFSVWLPDAIANFVLEGQISILGIGLFIRFDLHFHTNKMNYHTPFNSKVDFFHIGGSGAHFDPPEKWGSRGRKIPTPWNFIIEVLNYLFKQ